MMRSGNPTLNDDIFRNAAQGLGQASTSHSGTVVEKMTIAGTVNKSMLLLLICIGMASFTWAGDMEQASSMSGYAMVGGIVGFVIALITIFKKQWSPVTAPLYAAAEGIFLGAVSSIFELQYPGIVTQAVIGTMGTFAALLFAYKSGLIKATENFKLGVAAATGGIAMVYVIGFVLSFFGIQIPHIHESGLIGIGFSLFVVVIAALNLVMDFDFIEEGEKVGAPKYMEWFGAFSLIVTLVWLYLEMLRLLAKIQSRD